MTMYANPENKRWPRFIVRIGLFKYGHQYHWSTRFVTIPCRPFLKALKGPRRSNNKTMRPIIPSFGGGQGLS